MEGLKLRSFIVAGILLAFAAWVQLTPKPAPVAGRDETWMESAAPKAVANYKFISNPDPTATDQMCTFKSPKYVYETLVPTVGIVARVYEYRGERYEVYLIASRDHASFHDPRVCFTAQNYNIVQEDQILVPTETRGNIPATLAHMTGPDGSMIAVYFYKGPNGFLGTTTSLKFAMLFDQLKGKADADCVFYRFVSLGSQDTEKLKRFITMYMETAEKTSRGYF